LPGQLARHLRQAFDSTFGPAVDDRDVLTLDESDLFQALAECGKTRCHAIRRSAVEKSDHRHRRLLRARRERPNSRHAAEQRDELAPFHSITSSARAMSIGGTSRSSAFAVFRLITSSYLVGACTGSSPGLVPLRIRST